MGGAGARDDAWMRAALGLARRRLGRVAPNPAVGAVILRDGRVIGRGSTGIGGRPHAETAALADARARFGAEAIRGATVYVSLEPCAHHGRTPPCADALIEAGVARVVCPIVDPDPRVSGRGIARLREAGIVVDVGCMAEAARALNAGFLMRLAEGRPWITLKLAATLDGRIATAAGRSRWITGEAARARVHLMRARADAVMVGAGTIAADDPALTVRGFGAGANRPVRVGVDRDLAALPGSALAATAGEAPVWAIHGPDAPAAARAALAAAGVRLIGAPVEGGRLRLRAAMTALGSAGLSRVLAEGGAGLAAGLLAADLVDEIALFQAGRVIGAEGLGAIGALGGVGLGAVEGAPRFELVAHERVGSDIFGLWRAAGRAETLARDAPAL